MAPKLQQALVGIVCVCRREAVEVVVVEEVAVGARVMGCKIGDEFLAQARSWSPICWCGSHTALTLSSYWMSRRE